MDSCVRSVEWNYAGTGQESAVVVVDATPSEGSSARRPRLLLRRFDVLLHAGAAVGVGVVVAAPVLHHGRLNVAVEVGARIVVVVGVNIAVARRRRRGEVVPRHGVEWRGGEWVKTARRAGRLGFVEFLDPSRRRLETDPRTIWLPSTGRLIFRPNPYLFPPFFFVACGSFFSGRRYFPFDF
jgi:hypothetical protein